MYKEAASDADKGGTRMALKTRVLVVVMRHLTSKHCYHLKL